VLHVKKAECLIKPCNEKLLGEQIWEITNPDQPQEGAVQFLTIFLNRVCAWKHIDSFPLFIISVLEVVLVFILSFQIKNIFITKLTASWHPRVITPSAASANKGNKCDRCQ